MPDRQAGLIRRTRTGRFGTARAAALSAPEQAAPSCGIYMIALATGDKSLADSAMAEVRRRTVDPAAVTDSTLRNTRPAPAGQWRKSA